MTRRLVKTGNSVALIVTKDMRDHLGVDEQVDVQFEADRIILRKPLSFDEAKEFSLKRYEKAYRKLAE